MNKEEALNEVVKNLIEFISRASKENAKPEEVAVLADVAHVFVFLITN